MSEHHVATWQLLQCDLSCGIRANEALPDADFVQNLPMRIAHLQSSNMLQGAQRKTLSIDR